MGRIVKCPSGEVTNSGVDVTACSLDHPEPFAPADHTCLSQRLRWSQVNDHPPARPEPS